MSFFEVVGAIILFLLMLFAIYSAVSYWELKIVIKECNDDFGKGNWTFTESRTWYWTEYSCQASSQRVSSSSTSSSSSYTTSSSICYVDGREVPCP